MDFNSKAARVLRFNGRCCFPPDSASTRVFICDSRTSGLLSLLRHADTCLGDQYKRRKPSASVQSCPRTGPFFSTQNWEWSISSSHEAGLVGKSGYPVLLPVERSDVGPPAIALSACPTPPGPPCTTRLSMEKPRLLRSGVWPGREVIEEGD